MIPNNTISPKSNYTLSQTVDEYLALRQIDKKKYYASYLIASKWAWKKLFWNTMFVTSSVWKPILKGEPYNYIEVPKDAIRIFSIDEVDECGNTVNVFYNPKLNTLPKPKSNKGGKCCTGGVCEDVDNVTMTTTLLFTINGIDYYEKDWIKVCPNGDVIEYREVPTKKYNDFVGDGGDYMNDYNNDYLKVGQPFSDYSIVTETFQKTICKLKVKDCGCPIDDEENEQTLRTYCGCYLPPYNERRRKEYCAIQSGNINDNGRGEVKISECGTKIYYKPTYKGRRKRADHLLVNYQTNGEVCGTQVEIPEYAVEAMFCGIDYKSKQFNNAYSRGEKEDAKHAFSAAQNDVIIYLNALDLDYLSNIQDTPILY